MARLIQSHVECGHRLRGYCLYSKSILDNPPKCNPKGEDNFPKTCPLEVGVPICKFKRAIKLIK